MLVAKESLTMVEIIAAEIIARWPNLYDLHAGYSIGGKETPSEEEATGELQFLENLCGRIGWNDLRDQIKRVRRRLQAGEQDAAMQTRFEEIREAFEEKTASLHAVIIEEKDARSFADPVLEFCKTKLHPDLSISEEEFTLAGRALALGLSTAAVSHAMRSVEASLHILASQLGIVFPAPIQLQDWKVLTDKIKSVIDGLEKQSRSRQKSERLKILSELLLPMDAFRTVWRNHVVHAREKYEYDEARKAITHVGSYLGTLSRTI